MFQLNDNKKLQVTSQIFSGIRDLSAILIFITKCGMRSSCDMRAGMHQYLADNFAWHDHANLASELQKVYTRPGSNAGKTVTGQRTIFCTTSTSIK